MKPEMNQTCYPQNYVPSNKLNYGYQRILNIFYTYLLNLQDVENIIEKDFYPDLADLKSKAEYFEAIEKNDLVKLRKFQLKHTGGRPGTSRSDCKL